MLRKKMKSLTVVGSLAVISFGGISHLGNHCAHADLKESSAQQVDQRDPVIARVDKQVIRLSDMLKQLESLPLSPSQVDLEKIYPELLKQMTIRLASSKLARKKGLQNSLEYKKALQEMETSLLSQLYLLGGLDKDFTEDQLRAVYKEYEDSFVSTEEVQLADILVDKEEEAKEIIDRLLKGEEFSKLAERSKNKATAKNGGVMGYVSQNTPIAPELKDKIFALKDGEFTQTPLQGPGGYHVLKVLSRRMSKPVPYETAKAGLLPDLLKRKELKKRFEEAFKSAKIEMYTIDGKHKLDPDNPSAAIKGESSSNVVEPKEDGQKADKSVSEAPGKSLGKVVGKKTESN